MALPVVLLAGSLFGMWERAVWVDDAAPSAMEAGYITRVCVAVRPTWRFRAALWWGPPLNSRNGQPRKPFVGKSMVCGFAPWHPMLPSTGFMQTAR